MGARNQVGIGLSYRHASLCSLATQFQTRFLESILRPIAGLKFPTLDACIPFPFWLKTPPPPSNPFPPRIHPLSPPPPPFSARRTKKTLTAWLESLEHRVHRVATAAFWRTFSDEGKIGPGWWGWGGAFTITSKVAVYAPAEWADTLTLFHL
jgi:hypothetical protein